jgi:hypothetical protein
MAKVWAVFNITSYPEGRFTDITVCSTEARAEEIKANIPASGWNSVEIEEFEIDGASTQVSF